MESNWIYLLSRIPYIILQLLLLIGCILYMKVNKSTPVYLMLIGSILVLLSIVLSTVLQQVLMGGDSFSDDRMYLFTIAGIITGLGNLGFCLGFFILMLKLSRKKTAPKTNSSDILDSF